MMDDSCWFIVAVGDDDPFILRQSDNAEEMITEDTTEFVRHKTIDEPPGVYRVTVTVQSENEMLYEFPEN